ncbi:hypothetical protein AGMMS4956_04830 [Bacteroidia bacterium]|nr:hypothetical protein AGMMS4956_04830 [Bacteroidia bacterium]
MENTKNSSQDLGTKPQTSSKADGEVDLVDVLGQFGTFAWRVAQQLSKAIRWLWKALSVVLLFILRNILWLSIAVALGIALSYLSYQSRLKNPAVYRSDMVARMNVETNDFAIKFINDFGKSASTPQQWKQLLNLPDTLLATQIVSIAAYWGVDYNGDKLLDAIDMQHQYNQPTLRDSGYILSDRFYVVILTSSAEVVPYIEQAMKDKINSNPVLQRQKEVDKNAINTQIAAIDYQIKTLEELQRYEYFTKAKETKKGNANLLQTQGGQLIELHERDQRLLHNEVLALQRERLVLVEKLTRVEQDDMIEILQSPCDVLIQQTTYAAKSPSDVLIPTTYTDLSYFEIILLCLIVASIIILAINNKKWLLQLWHPKAKE